MSSEDVFIFSSSVQCRTFRQRYTSLSAADGKKQPKIPSRVSSLSSYAQMGDDNNGTAYIYLYCLGGVVQCHLSRKESCLMKTVFAAEWKPVWPHQKLIKIKPQCCPQCVSEEEEAKKRRKKKESSRKQKMFLFFFFLDGKGMDGFLFFFC